MGKFYVDLVDASNDYGPRNKLVICYPDGSEAAFFDRGEPEDNTFDRDYAWIKPELEQAYDAGYNVALEVVEQFRNRKWYGPLWCDAADAIILKLRSKWGEGDGGSE